LVQVNPLNQPGPKSAGQVKVTKAQVAETNFLISETLLQYQPSNPDFSHRRRGLVVTPESDAV
jgi:hypothetical protein